MAHAGLPDVAAIAPDAPGQSWWPTSFLAPAVQMEPYVQAGIARMLEAVAELERDGLPRGRIWLGGFSQGACLALEVFARHGDGLAGVIAMSGGLVGTGDAGPAGDEALGGFRPKSFHYVPHAAPGRVWISVHERDPHIPLRRVEESAAVLATLGAAVETRLYPGAGHGVMADDIGILRRWLNRA
jgi:phospholipase/carboxylesterase